MENNKYAAQMKYNKENIVRVVLSLNKNTDKEILEKIKILGKGNVQLYFKKLAENDISNDISERS